MANPIMTRETLVPVGVAVACCGAFLSGALWITTAMTRVKDEVKDVGFDVKTLTNRLDSIERKLDGGSYLEQREFQNWVEQLKLANTSLVVPRPQ